MHEIVIDGVRLALDDVIELGAGDRPALRVHRLTGGDAVVIAAGEATRDGRPLLAGLGVVEWGCGALVRAGRLRAEVAWVASHGRRAACAGHRCRICFGSFPEGEAAVACGCCDTLFHTDCGEVCITCPACGSPPEELAR